MNLSEACAIIYGPIQSRRHGRSLGINLGNPLKKICTWSCVYCQCGVGERRDVAQGDELPTKEEVLAEFSSALRIAGEIDSVTFAGNSEPTAHPDFFEIVRGIRKIKYAARGSWVLNCLSNGSQLDDEKVVRGCDLLDEAWIKLDCGTDLLFKKFNHPVARVEGVRRHADRIRRLKNARIQSLFWHSPIASNWTEENRSALRGLYGEIQPKEIHLTTVSRAPAWPGAEPVPLSELDEFAVELRRAGLSVGAFA